jgi:hypothetical protein
VKMSDYDRGVIVGIGLACAIIQRDFDNPVACAEVLNACALNRRKLKRAGLPDYDLKALRPVFRDMQS